MSTVLSVRLEATSSFFRVGVILWCLSLGVLSFLVLPGVQGTVPAYLLAFVSVPLCVAYLYDNDSQRLAAYIRDWGLLGVFWGFFFVTSQLGYFFTDAGLVKGMNYISADSTMLFRKSMFTQSMYLIACFATFTFFRHWPLQRIGIVFFAAAWFVALYGIYEWSYFLLTGSTGDFIVNRTFESVDGSHTASWAQGIRVAGLELIRVKSTLGEPSFLSAVAVPFFFAAYLLHKRVLAAALLFCVVFSWSSSAYAGVFVGLVLLCIFGGEHRRASLMVLAAAGIVMVGIIVFLPDIFQGMVVDKLTGMNDSGAIRMDLSELRNKGLEELTLWNRVFGIGYGYVYSSVWEATIDNLGWAGAVCFSAFFLSPFVILYLRRSFSVWGFSCVVLFVLFVVNVAELYLPTTWAFLGLAWRSVDESKTRRVSKEIS